MIFGLALSFLILAILCIVLGFSVKVLLAYLLISAICVLLLIALLPILTALPTSSIHDDHEDWKP